MIASKPSAEAATQFPSNVVADMWEVFPPLKLSKEFHATGGCQVGSYLLKE